MTMPITSQSLLGIVTGGLSWGIPIFPHLLNGMSNKNEII